MIILLQSLNEEKMVEPVIGDFYDCDWVSRIIVIDGGSQDFTVSRIMRFGKKCSVYHHHYDRKYHSAQSMQRNISLSYVPLGDICFILDFDEKMSDDLKAFLADVDKYGMPEGSDVVHVSRISYESMRHEDSPFALLDEQGFPIPSHTIGQYPDFQSRLIKRNNEIFFINSPHHILIGGKKQISREDTDIIHYHGKTDARDRENIEILWAYTQARRKELGLAPEVFEAKLKPEFAEYGSPGYWK